MNRFNGIKIVKIIVIFLSFGLSGFPGYSQAGLPDNCNIVWNSQSKNASESMPCGGGDIGMNVWVEDGDLLVYVAKSGNFNEDNALMKTGRIRIRLTPNPFVGKVFKQELHLKEGFVTVEGEHKGVKGKIRIWADVFKPVVHFEISANQKIAARASYESWRYRDRTISARENYGNSWKWTAPKHHQYYKDSIRFAKNSVSFFHKNRAETIFDATVKQQGLDSVRQWLYNPLKDLIFGGSFEGEHFVADGTDEGVYQQTDFKAWHLRSAGKSKTFLLNLYLYNKQTAETSDWNNGLDSLKRTARQTKFDFQKNQQWWSQFWQRSFVDVDVAHPNSEAWQTGRNFQLFRYMLALNAFGDWPTKFNGGLLTVDPCFTDTIHDLTPDYRLWGGGLHTMQNQRLVYFPMIRNGDFDMMQSQFNFYTRLLKTAELRSEVYWNHAGACFTEQMENFGLPNFAEYGTKRPPYFDKGVEYNAWLEYEWDTVLEFCQMILFEQEYTGTDISDKIPFIESCLRFFDDHYQYLAKHRGIKPLTQDGKLVLFPGSGAETYKMAYNATSTIAALQTVTKELLSLPHNYLSDSSRTFWKKFLGRIPDISYGNFDGHATIAPALSWERINNVESPQLYPVFPWGIFGVGKPGIDTALNTYKYDTSVVKFRSYVGWKQDNIWAARLGLTDDAWELTKSKLKDSDRRFPAFWGPGFDWVPDFNWGGSGMIGLQEMLLQTNGDTLLLFPAWPKDVDVHFKLYAPKQTTVEAELSRGRITKLVVSPEYRRKDVICDEPLPPAP